MEIERRLKVGVQLPEVEREVRWSELLRMSRTIEDVGFDSIWVGDHLLFRAPDGTPRGPWESFSLLAALAAATSRVELGPLVAATSFRNPAVLAKQAATIDEISGGRLILGLGAGWHQPEYQAFGLPFDHRVSRFGEALTIIRTLLQDGAIDFAGTYYEARDCELRPRGPRQHGPPLMVGSIGPRMLDLTMPHVQLWNGWYDWFDNTAPGYTALRDSVDEACRKAGRDPAEVGRTVALYVQLPGGRGRVRGDPAANQVTPLSGTPSEIAARVATFAAAGVEHVQLVLDPITVESIDALGPTLVLLHSLKVGAGSL